MTQIYMLWKGSTLEGDQDELVAVWSKKPGIEAIAREAGVDFKTTDQRTILNVVRMAIHSTGGWEELTIATGTARSFKIEVMTEADY